MFFPTKVITFIFAGIVLVNAQGSGGCARQYTVQSGDTCDAIGASQNAPTLQIISANQGTINDQCNNLQVGASICLGLSGMDCQTVVTAVDGDTCSQIATVNKIPLATFMANNPGISAECTDVHSGQVVCTASGPLSK